MTSKKCLVRQRRVSNTLQLLAQLTPRWAARLEHRFDEVGLPTAASNLQPFLRALGVALDHRFDALRQAQDEREAWASRLGRLRRMRDEAHDEVYDRMKRIRRMTDLVFGAAAQRELFGVGNTPRVPADLAEQARRVLTRLDHPDYRALLERRQTDPWPGWWDLVDSLREPLSRLEVVLGELVDAEMAKTRSVESRNRELQRLDGDHKGLTAFLEGLSRLTGEEGALDELKG